MYEVNKFVELRRDGLLNLRIRWGLHNMSPIHTGLRSVSENPKSKFMC